MPRHERDTRDGIDRMLRHASRPHPRALPKPLFGIDEPIEETSWVETQVTGRQRRVDRALCVKSGKKRRWLHVEWTVRLDELIDIRVYEYNHLLNMAAHADAKAVRKEGKRPPKPIRVNSVVVVLTGPKSGVPKRGSYRTSSKGEPFSGVRYRIEAIYQRAVAEIEAMAADSVFWLVFVPLAVDVDERAIVRALESLQTSTNQRDFEDLAATMFVLATLKEDGQRMMDVISSRVSRSVMLDNWLYKEGRKEGLEKGLERGLEKGRAELLVLQFEQRLSRALTTEEQKCLVARLHKEGPQELAKAVLNLSGAKLAAWLLAHDQPRRRVRRAA